MIERENSLLSILKQMVEDIKDPECFYWVHSNYFDIQPPTERKLTQWHHTPLFLNYDALWNPEFVEDGILFDVILKNQLPAEKERIKLRYDQIYSIKRVNYGELTRSETEGEVHYLSKGDGTIYSDRDKIRHPPGYGNSQEIKSEA